MCGNGVLQERDGGIEVSAEGAKLEQAARFRLCLPASCLACSTGGYLLGRYL